MRPIRTLLAPPLIGLALGLAIGPHTAAAQTIEVLPELPEQDRKALAQNPESYLRNLLQRLAQHGPDRVATPETVARVDRIGHARRRAQIMQNLLAMDIDGDGQVTSAELSDVVGPELTGAGNALALARQGRWLPQFEEADVNRDGVLTIPEIAASAERQLAERADQGRRGNLDMMLFDLDGNARVDADELTRAVTLYATSLAAGGAEARGRASCEAPIPPRDAEIVLLSVGRGRALSSVAALSQDDITTVVRLRVEPGEAPLYILAASEATVIWEVTGEIGRIVHFAAQLPNRGGGFTDGTRAPETGAGVGVVGLSKGVVGFLRGASCFQPYREAGDANAALGAARLGARFGRPVDHVFRHLGQGSLALPSGTAMVAGDAVHGKRVLVDGQPSVVIGGTPVLIEPGTDTTQSAKPSADRTLQKLVDRQFPEGVVDIDPLDVVAPTPLGRYEVLPGAAGLLQLIEAGLIRREANRFLIARPIPRFPPGLAGAGGVEFILGTGVPMPLGNPGHSSVFAEDTGECLAGVRCRN